MKNFAQRATTAVVFVAVLLGSIWWDPFSFGLLFLVITLLATYEFYTLAEKDGIKALKGVGVFGAFLIFVGNFAVAMDMVETSDLRWALLLLPYVFIILIIELFRKTENPFTNIAFTLLGLIYVALPFSLLIYLGTHSSVEGTTSGNLLVAMPAAYHYGLIFGFFFILWANDTGAYLIGSMIGKRKLFERVSPNKSWEGSIGGGLTSLGVAWACSYFFGIVSLVDWLILGVIIVITGSLGDLVESRLKRSMDIKDSGTILPGHGGMLDRFDAVLMAVPFVITYLYLSQG